MTPAPLLVMIFADSFTAPTYATPPRRRMVVPSESRTLAVANESRVMAVPREAE